jgi:hypothetical protein
MSRLIEEELVLPAVPGHGEILEYVSRAMENHLGEDRTPVRFAITGSDDSRYHCEIGTLIETDQKIGDSIFRFVPRQTEHTSDFNAVLLVPTGIGAEIGGHAGDAGPVAALLASICDTLVTHPNVVNASDIMELPGNALYVEGSVLSALLMGTVGLQRVRSNRVLVVVDAHEEKLFTDAAINSVNAARAAYGLICPLVVSLDSSFTMSSQYSTSGRAVGEVRGLEDLLTVLTEHRDEYDAIAISTVIGVPRSYHSDYFAGQGQMVNPWGGVEAMLTHAVSLLYRAPSAHSPMLEAQEVFDLDVGIVDPRMAAEAVSLAFLQCILKGMQRSPKIVTDVNAMQQPEVLTVSDIACLVIPDGCIGLPTLAAMEQGVPVIAVRDNKNLMRNDLTALPWRQGQLHIVENYWEAAGVMGALRAGVDPRAVRRPIAPVVVEARTMPSATPVEVIAARPSPF